MYLSFITSELGIRGFPVPFILQMDNSAAIIFTRDTGRVSRLKHIDTRQCWVQDMRNSDVVDAIFVPSADNLADLLTKPLAAPTFRHLLQRIM